MLAVEQDLEQSRKENAEMERDLERERRAKEQIESKLEIAEKERTNLRREVDSLRYVLSSLIWSTEYKCCNYIYYTNVSCNLHTGMRCQIFD